MWDKSNKSDLLGALIRPFGASIYTPPGSVSGDADQATLCPMGSRCLGLNAAIRMPSAMVDGVSMALSFHLYDKHRFVR